MLEPKAFNIFSSELLAKNKDTVLAARHNCNRIQLLTRYNCNRIQDTTGTQVQSLARYSRIQLQPDTIATGYNCNRIQLQPDTIVNCLINVTSLKNNVVTMKKLPLPKT